jgi:hypothetical protein
MQDRDSFGLTYSRTVQGSNVEEETPQEEELQQLSPNKQSMLQTFKENIELPLQT